MNRRIGFVAAVAIAAPLLAGCGSDGGKGTSNAVKITEHDYSYDVSGDLAPGTATVEVENAGKELHMLGIARLKSGKTVSDVRAALKTAGDNADEVLGKYVEGESGELGGIEFPGSKFELTSAGMKSGNYVVVCFLPDAKGKPHYSSGMVNGFTVKGDAEKDVPDADVTFTSTSSRLTGPKSVKSGDRTIKVRNASGASREIVLVKVKDGKTIDDVDAFFKKLDEEGPGDLSTAPVEFMTYRFDSKQDRYLTIDLTAGQWGIGVQDPEDSSDLPAAKDPNVVLFKVS